MFAQNVCLFLQKNLIFVQNTYIFVSRSNYFCPSYVGQGESTTNPFDLQPKSTTTPFTGVATLGCVCNRLYASCPPKMLSCRFRTLRRPEFSPTDTPCFCGLTIWILYFEFIVSFAVWSKSLANTHTKTYHYVIRHAKQVPGVRIDDTAVMGNYNINSLEIFICVSS
jgi:hypothetical protein